MTTFDDLGLAGPIPEAIFPEGNTTLTSIQAHAIPTLMMGEDDIGIGQVVDTTQSFGRSKKLSAAFIVSASRPAEQHKVLNIGKSNISRNSIVRQTKLEHPADGLECMFFKIGSSASSNAA